MSPPGTRRRAPYVMIGQSHGLGDLVENIHLNGGFVATVVTNVDDAPKPRRKSFEQRLRALVDRYPEYVERPIAIASLDAFEVLSSRRYVMGFMGEQSRALAEELTKLGVRFSKLVHPSAIVATGVEIGAGAVIDAAAVIATGVRIGPHALVKRGATIGHDSTLAPFSVVQPGATVCGYVTIRSGALVGAGATVIEDRVVGERARVAAGACVLDDVPDDTLVAGVPAVAKGGGV